jgi:GntR family transcriptional regulator
VRHLTARYNVAVTRARGEGCGERPCGRAGLRPLEIKYNTPLIEAEYKLEAAAADSVAAQALQVSAGSPILLIERTSYTTGNRAVDYERLHYRGDLIRFVTRLARRPRTPTEK